MGHEESEGNESSGGGFLHSPFFWGFVLGAAVLTLIRPCTRFKPEPPPRGMLIPESRTPRVDLAHGVVDEGATFRHSASTPPIMVVVLVPTACGDLCHRSLSVASAVERRAERSDLPLEFSTIGTLSTGLETLARLRREHYPYGSNWTTFRTEEPQVLASVLDGRDGERSSRSFETIAKEGWLWIVDASGHLRGRYDSSSEDAELEVFHRSRHVYEALENKGENPG